MPPDILAAPQLPVLRLFALSNVLLAFDYDGTLAPIASAPERAHMRARTRRLLADVTHRYPCVVISGRKLDDLTKRLQRIPVWLVFGNHGLEPAAESDTSEHCVHEWMQELTGRFPPDSGIVVEEKKYSITLHYRHAPDTDRALSTVLEATRALPNARAIGGVLAVSVIPLGAPDKGVALQRARRQFACDTAIYVGDDGTDEDAFGSDSCDRLLSVRVGEPAASRARFSLKTQADMDALLEALLVIRRRDFSTPPVVYSR